MSNKSKRVLLVNPAKQDWFAVDRIHMGLSIIGAVLVSDGHEVKLMDYTFLKDLEQVKTPSIEEVIYEFKPDVIGVTVFTYFYNECQTIIEKVSQCCDAPIVLGGPHFTVFPKDFSDDRRISYIVHGEAEMVISGLIESAKRQSIPPVFIDAPLPASEEIQAVNLDVVYGSRYLISYQMQLSRGCPYNCSFCNIHDIAGHRIRGRNLETCLNQIVEAKRCYPSIKVISITDDCPNFNKERFKQFLCMFIEANTGCKLSVDHMRANLIDEEMVQLYKAAGGQSICLGVESGHPEVFKLINKGESLEQIISTAKLVRKYRLGLGLCFVIGLPEDNLKRHLYSVRLAKRLKPDFVFWNMCIPWSGTKIRQWYERYRKIGDPRNFSTLIDPKLNFNEPVCESPSFPKKDMIKAWLIANLETDRPDNYPIDFHGIRRLVSLAHKYRIYRSVAIYYFRYFSLHCKRYLLRCKHYILGVKQFINRFR